MRILKAVIILCLFNSCSSNNFELVISEQFKSPDYFVRYNLTENNLILTIGTEIPSKKDSIVYLTSDFEKHRVKQFSKINLDSLATYYANVCISGGDTKLFRIINDGKSKSIRLDNYYHNDLSPSIEFINELVPEKYKLNYNKDKLIKDIIECDKKYPRN